MAHAGVRRDHFAELNALGVAQVFGASIQDSDYQRKAAKPLHLPVPWLRCCR
jgi:peroxiredoxin